MGDRLQFGTSGSRSTLMRRRGVIESECERVFFRVDETSRHNDQSSCSANRAVCLLDGLSLENRHSQNEMVLCSLLLRGGNSQKLRFWAVSDRFSGQS